MMNGKKKFKRLRILFIILIVFVFWAFNYYPCLSLDLISLPQKLKNHKDIKDALLLYGSGVCSSCSTGQYVYDLRERKDILFIVPSNFTQYEIKNLKDIFALKGTVMNGDEDVMSLVERINDCKDLNMWKANYHVRFGKNGKITSIKAF
jgi:hypothetical protein